MICIQCNKKKICRIFDFMKQFNGEVSYAISQCNYYQGAVLSPLQQQPNPIQLASRMKDPEEVNNRSEAIRNLQKQKKNDLPSSPNFTVE